MKISGVQKLKKIYELKLLLYDLKPRKCFQMSASFMQRWRLLPFNFIIHITQILKNTSQKIFKYQISKWE